MKALILNFIKTYFLLVFLFILWKPLFMWFHHGLYAEVGTMDYFEVMLHGLPLDLSVAGYFSMVPGLLLIASLWIPFRLTTFLRRGYFYTIAFIFSVIFIPDLVLYHYWGFRLDSTPLFYFFSSPKGALASAGTGAIVAGIGAIFVYIVLFCVLFEYVLIRGNKRQIVHSRLMVTGAMLPMVGLLFIPIRGSFTVSVMNLSKVYYSENLRLNHAAINPCFSLMESLFRKLDFDKQYRFMSSQEVDEIFSFLTDKPPVMNRIPALFTCERPNVVFVILESFLSKAMESLGGIPGIAVNMDKLGEAGILFTNFYANSFRTDRGLVSIIAGYPAQPTMSIMKYPQKAESLPSISRSLQRVGYDLQYYYGGDADFTNMRSFLLAAGFNRIVSDKDFPVQERLSKWGVHDHVVFSRFLSDLESKPYEPFMKIIQTSSSHEPFDVPYHRLEDPFLNAVAYTDSCLGDFISRFKQTDLWEHTLVVLVPDHAGSYPYPTDNLSPGRYQIPLILTGGAIKSSMKIDACGSQIDIAATLLSQLGLPHDEFTFSKNLLNPASPHYAFFTYPNAFGMITPENQLVFDCDAEQVHSDTGIHPGENLMKGKAILQKLYDDLAAR
ncbi:Lipoteichoic acid synthase 2 [termite gut metagenome]|uniref:Lipoteichoic acid synthase 2 n=1 Tax=termite gut metagenome TaxID=433724 RepID=A0A5J4T1Y2_9ZZZZ